MASISILPMGLALAMKVMISVNSAWNLLNFREGLIKALISDGHNVVLVAQADENVTALQMLGAKFINLPIKSNSINPITDALLFFRFLRLLILERPNVLLCYTVKPNVFGSLAANIIGIPLVNNISGLGSAFIRGDWLSRLIQILYQLSLKRSKRIFFQNPDDLQFFLKLEILCRDQTRLLPGSGVDLFKFQKVPLPFLLCHRKANTPEQRDFVFLLVARMIKDKGIEEYVQSAKIIKGAYPLAQFALLGYIDCNNPNAIEPEKLQEWVAEGIVNYWGSSTDVRLQLSKADCVVLPSYREGTPRSLLEAAAMGRPIIATDVPGCREVVRDGVNGFLCNPKDANSLAQKMKQFLSMSDSQIKLMANESRKLVEHRFDEKLVITEYRKILDEIHDLYGENSNNSSKYQ